MGTGGGPGVFGIGMSVGVEIGGSPNGIDGGGGGALL